MSGESGLSRRHKLEGPSFPALSTLSVTKRRSLQAQDPLEPARRPVEKTGRQTGRLRCLGNPPGFHWKLVKNGNSLVEHFDFNEWHILMRKCFVRNFLASLFTAASRQSYFMDFFFSTPTWFGRVRLTSEAL